MATGTRGIIWIARLIGAAFFGLFFCAGLYLTYKGLFYPLNLENTEGIEIYELASFGLLFLTLGFVPLYFLLRPEPSWKDYLKPVDAEQPQDENA